MAPNASFKKYALLGGENTFASASATSEGDARKLQSLIPSLSGALEREHPLIPFTADAAFPSRIGFFHQFKQNASGVITYFFFCATATTLYKLSFGGSWQVVTQVGTLAGFPVAVNINNQMHLSDGTTSWLFDGTSWITDGLPIPLRAPSIAGFSPGPSPPSNISSVSRVNGVVSVTITAPQTVAGFWQIIAGVADSSFNGTVFVPAGGITTTPTQTTFQYAQIGPDAVSINGTVTGLNFNVISNRYYWTTFIDGTRSHESSSSPISKGTGVLTNNVVTVRLRSGVVTTTNGSTSVVGSGTDFTTNDVGMTFYIGSSGVGATIASVQDNHHLTLATGAAFSIGGSPYLILPTRATGWNLYASASEEDKIGNLLSTNNVLTPFYYDQSPMIGTVGSYFSGVQRPLLNDPPNPTTRMEVFKNRIWRRDEKLQNFFSYTGYEEILAEQAGSPYESVPGAAGTSTVSTQINETSYPDQSVHVRGLRAHGDSLYIGTDINTVPLYGNSLTTFGLSDSAVFAVGFAGRRASCSTPFGLAFVSYDLKVYLYPSQYNFGVDSTTALVELGRPKRPEFETILGSDLDQVFLIFYNWGRRNWLVLTYQKTDGTYGSWVFDFEVKGWFQLQRGYTAVAVFEMTPGRKVLVGAGTDFKTYVIDDLTGTFALSGNYPVGYLRQLIDFGDPNSVFVIQDIEFESSDPLMQVDVTIWLDPQDPDNPGVGIPILMGPKTIGPGGSLVAPSSRFGGRPNSTPGATCQRVLVEFAVAASTRNGLLRGITVEGKKVTDPAQ